MNLLDYLNKGHSQYQVIETVTNRLKESGYKEVKLDELENVGAGRYYLKVYDTALFALNIPANHKGALRVAAAHTDFPCFKIKPIAHMNTAANLKRLNIEPYGGMIKRSWFDRPLGIAGAIWTRGDDEFTPEIKIVDIDESLLFIPSIAPHLDRELEKRAIDPAKELVPVYGLEDEDSIMDVVAAKTGCAKDDILSFDLSLFSVDQHRVAGGDDEFIIGQGLDNMVSVAALTEALIANDIDEEHISMICLYDNEEIGSRTKQGADSSLIMTIVDKLGISYEESYLISVDGAHGLHPNYPEKYDQKAQVIMGQGVAIKTSASQRYATDAKMMAIIKAICQKNHIKYQLQANKSGEPGGSTLGPIMSSYLPIRSVDIGIPMLAMHSICETIAKNDYEHLLKLINKLI